MGLGVTSLFRGKAKDVSNGPPTYDEAMKEKGQKRGTESRREIPSSSDSYRVWKKWRNVALFELCVGQQPRFTRTWQSGTLRLLAKRYTDEDDARHWRFEFEPQDRPQDTRRLCLLPESSVTTSYRVKFKYTKYLEFRNIACGPETDRLRSFFLAGSPVRALSDRRRAEIQTYATRMLVSHREVRSEQVEYYHGRCMLKVKNTTLHITDRASSARDKQDPNPPPVAAAGRPGAEGRSSPAKTGASTATGTSLGEGTLKVVSINEANSKGGPSRGWGLVFRPRGARQSAEYRFWLADPQLPPTLEPATWPGTCVQLRNVRWALGPSEMVFDLAMTHEWRHGKIQDFLETILAKRA